MGAKESGGACGSAESTCFAESLYIPSILTHGLSHVGGLQWPVDHSLRLSDSELLPEYSFIAVVNTQCHCHECHLISNGVHQHLWTSVVGGRKERGAA